MAESLRSSFSARTCWCSFAATSSPSPPSLAPQSPVPILQLTETESSERALAASPDGRALAFLRDGDLFLASGLSSESGPEELRQSLSRAARLTRVAGEARGVSQFRWSPDGRRISIVETDQSGVAVRSIPDYLTDETSADQVRRAYPGEEPMRQRIGLVTLDEQRAQAVGAIVWPQLAPAGQQKLDSLLSHRWSDDSRFLAVDTSDLYVKDRRILRVSVETGEVVEWAREQNPRSVSQYFWRIEWAPSSSGLYVISDYLGAEQRGGEGVSDYHLFHLDLEGKVSQLTSGAFAIAELEVLPQGVLLVNNRGRGEERQLDLLAHPETGAGAKEPVRVSTLPGTHQPIASPDGRFIADLFSNDSTPPDLYLISLDETSGTSSGAAERKLTDSPLDEFDRYRWVAPRYVTFPSRVDGVTLHGRLTVPPEYDPTRRYPAILGSVYTDSVRNQWGGRTAHPTWGLDQHLVQQGYVLLNVDMRGSWGRGREFREGIELSYGGPDVEDLASGVDYLATLGFVDMERIGMWGSSYGGLMTCMSLFRHPELYCGGFRRRTCDQRLACPDRSDGCDDGSGRSA